MNESIFSKKTKSIEEVVDHIKHIFWNDFWLKQLHILIVNSMNYKINVDFWFPKVEFIIWALTN
jgi:glycogen debranching enzyme